MAEAGANLAWMTNAPRLRLGQLLVDARLITQDALDDVLAAQKQDGRRIGTLLMERGHISEVQLTQILSHQLSVPWVSLHKIDFSRQLLNLVPQELADRHCLLPIYVRRIRGHGDTLYIAMDDPTNEEALRACAAYAGLPVRPMIAPPSDIRSAIRAYYGLPSAETEPPPALSPEASPSPAAPPAAPVDPVVKAAPAHEPAHAPAATRARAHAQTLRSAIFEEPAPDHVEAPAEAPPDSVPAIVRDSRPTPLPSSSLHPAKTPARPATSAADDPVIEVTPLRPRSAEHAVDRAAAIPAPRGKAPKMVSLTLLDGTTITLPAPRQKGSAAAPKVHAEAPAPAPDPPADPSSTLTARDMVDALRAIAGGADARALLGEEIRWEAMFAALLSAVLKKQLIADWEFVEELNRLQKR